MSILIYIINHHIKHTTPLHPLLHTQPHPSSYFLLQAGWQHLATSWLKLFEELLNSNIYNPHNKSLGYIRTLGFEDWVSPDVIYIYIIHIYIYVFALARSYPRPCASPNGACSFANQVCRNREGSVEILSHYKTHDPQSSRGSIGV